MKEQQGSCNVRTDKDWLYVLALHLNVKHSKSFAWNILVINLMFRERKMKNVPDLNISVDSADSLYTENPQN